MSLPMPQTTDAMTDKEIDPSSTMTDIEKALLLAEMMDMTLPLAKSWFPYNLEKADDYGSTRRADIIQAVRDIESGIVFSPLYKALS